MQISPKAGWQKCASLRRAFYHHGLGKLRAVIRPRAKLAEKGFAQRLGGLRTFRVRRIDIRRAAHSRRARNLHRRLLGKSEGHEEGRIVDVDGDGLVTRIE